MCGETGGGEPAPLPLPYFSVQQIEALARATEGGGHRDPTAQGVGEGELAARAAEDAQDAELARRSVPRPQADRLPDLVRRRRGRLSEKAADSARVPLPDRAAAALDRLSRRSDHIGPDEHCFDQIVSTEAAGTQRSFVARSRCG
jgi:hypothetical protein